MKIKITKKEQKIEDATDPKKIPKKSKRVKHDQLTKAAQNTIIEKYERINLRLPSEVLNFYKKLAKIENIPYQTLIGRDLYKCFNKEKISVDKADMEKSVRKIIREELKKAS